MESEAGVLEGEIVDEKDVGGRPTEFDAEKARLIIEHVKRGNYVEVSAAAAGVQRPTLYRWLKEGYKGKTPELKKFSDDYLEAQGQAEITMTGIILKAGLGNPSEGIKGQWTAIAWLLERMKPEKYGRRDVVDVKVTLRNQVEAIALKEGMQPEQKEQLLLEAEKIYKTLED